MPVSVATYEQLVLEDPDRIWELHCGRLVEKPAMTAEHNLIPRLLLLQLVDQIDRARYLVAEGTARLRISTGTFYVPDLCVLTWESVNRAITRHREAPGQLEVYEEPVPLVVEVWSPSTGEYDVDRKLAEYQQRGDLEVWRIHPDERTLTAWVRQPDGSYTETIQRGGVVRLAALPGVAIDLDAIFAAA